MTDHDRPDHTGEWPVHGKPEILRATELMRRGRTFDYRHGPELAGLEEGFSRLHEGRHALALNSGTSALLAAYHALGIGPGDEVVVPDLTFLATASPLFLLGAVPVLCDSGDAWGNVTAETIRERIGPRTRAIVVTHLFGRPCPMDEIAALAREHGLPLVEDCSHAHGSTYRGRRVGTFGDLAVFSIGGLKLVSGGMGGVLLAKERRHYEIACLLSSFQQRSQATVTDPGLLRLADVGLGGNLRISPIAAVLAKAHLDRLDTLVESKERNVSRLVEALAWEGVRVPGPGPEHTMGGWYDVVVEVDPDRAGFSRDDLVHVLQSEGVRSRVPRTAPLHRTSVFRGDPAADGPLPYPDEVRSRFFSYTEEDFPRSTALHDRWVSLPGTFFNDEEGRLVEPYVRAIARARRKLRQGGAAPARTGSAGRAAGSPGAPCSTSSPPAAWSDGSTTSRTGARTTASARSARIPDSTRLRSPPICTHPPRAAPSSSIRATRPWDATAPWPTGWSGSATTCPASPRSAWRSGPTSSG
ncbi:DegT/DnrJ/EryC1/StrS family aminotransferase [Nocardiopsis sp. ARC36]